MAALVTRYERTNPLVDEKCQETPAWPTSEAHLDEPRLIGNSSARHLLVQRSEQLAELL